MHKINYIIISILLLNACSSYQYMEKNIIVKQVPCDKSILLLRDTIKNEIYGMIVLYDFEIYKTCLRKVTIDPPAYYHGYNRYECGGEVKYLLQDNKYLLFDGYDKMSVLYYRKPRIYRIETWQLIDSNAYVKSKDDRPKTFSYTEQKQFLTTYLDSMNKLHLDTLRIGSIAEVQRNNPKFFNYFINGDTLLINFFNKKTGSIPKFVPIEIK